MEILTKFINGKESLNGRTIQDEANVTILLNKPECESDEIMFANYFSHLNTHSIQWITNALTNLDGNLPLPPITNIHSLHTSLAYIIMQKYNVEDLTPSPPLYRAPRNGGDIKANTQFTTYKSMYSQVTTPDDSHRPDVSTQPPQFFHGPGA